MLAPATANGGGVPVINGEVLLMSEVLIGIQVWLIGVSGFSGDMDSGKAMFTTRTRRF